MAFKNKAETKTKKADILGQDINPVLTRNSSDVQDNNITSEDEFQKKYKEFLEKSPNEKIRYAWAVVYPTQELYEEWYENRPKEEKDAPHYNGEEGWGTFTKDTFKNIVIEGVAFSPSDPHVCDRNPDETAKKPHMHIIFDWNAPTTGRAFAKFLDKVLGDSCAKPQILTQPYGAYRYLTHKDNPEKCQNYREPKRYNGFEIPDASEDETRISYEITQRIILENINEYATLSIVAHSWGKAYEEYVRTHTIQLNAICKGMRHNPQIILHTWLVTTDEEDLKKQILHTLGFIEDEVKDNESED